MKKSLFQTLTFVPAALLLTNLMLVGGMLAPSAIAAPRWRFKPPNRGAPGTNGSGASRPSCPVMAKFPVILASTTSNWGETIDAKPTFWFYQPYEGVSIELSLTDEETQKTVFSQQYVPKKGTGMRSLEYPKTAPELAVDKVYRWQVNFVCDAKTNQSFGLNGAIVRRKVSNPLKCQLKRAKPEDRVALLAEQGLWYNTVNELIALRRKQPKDPVILENWQNLMKDAEVQLENWMNEPFLD
jgi:hypothetical protein